MNKIGDKVIFIGDNSTTDIIWKLEYGEMYINKKKFY